MELYASYVYTAMAHHFDRWDVALKGTTYKILMNLHTPCRSRPLQVFQRNGWRRKWTCEQVHEIPKQTRWYHRSDGHQSSFLSILHWNLALSRRIETCPTKLELAPRSTPDRIAIGEGCVSSTVGIACLGYATQVRSPIVSNGPADFRLSSDPHLSDYIESEFLDEQVGDESNDHCIGSRTLRMILGQVDQGVCWLHHQPSSGWYRPRWICLRQGRTSRLNSCHTPFSCDSNLIDNQ